MTEDDAVKLVTRVGRSIHLAPECVPDVQNRGRGYPFVDPLIVCVVRVVALKLECENLRASVGGVGPTSRPSGITPLGLAPSAHTRFDIIV